MKRDYQAYLLRFQRNQPQTHWRVMLKDAASGEVRHFAHENEAIRFLLKRLAEEPVDISPISPPTGLKRLQNDGIQ